MAVWQHNRLISASYNTSWKDMLSAAKKRSNSERQQAPGPVHKMPFFAFITKYEAHFSCQVTAY
jgi:hypothetical protein